MTGKKENGDGEGPNKFFGRTLRSWGEILGYYLIYYTFLVLFWLAIFSLFTMFLDKEKPTLEAADTRIGAHPAIVVKPGQDEGHLSSSLFRLTLNYPQAGATVGTIRDIHNIGYVARMRQYFDIFEANGKNADAVDCTKWDDKKKTWEGMTDKENQWCHLNLTDVIGECYEFPYGYGYRYLPNENDDLTDVNTREKCIGWEPAVKAGHSKTLSPCVLIKVNRLFGFQFKRFDEKLAEAEKMDDWPKALTDKIKKHWEEQKFNDRDKHEMYIDCQGVYPDDREALEGTTTVLRWHEGTGEEGTGSCKLDDKVPRIEYFPKHQGINAKYFPFNNKKNKENPLVAVRFNNLHVGRLVNIKCTAFYPGSDSYDARKDDEDLGTVRFELYLDDEKDFVFS